MIYDENKIIEFKEVSRIFKGKKQIVEALKNVSFDVKKGEVFGIIGPNGAGKTTLIKILSTLLIQTSGYVRLFDIDITKYPEKVRRKINFVYGGEKGVYGRLTANEYIDYFCILYKISKRTRIAKRKYLLEKVGLENAVDRKIHTYSKGMIERLHLARALINDPEIIFLDEPTVGLDPEGSLMLRGLIRKIKEDGVTVILTTHYMLEADELCDRIAFINNGELLDIDYPAQLKSRAAQSISRYEIIVEENNEEIKNFITSNYELLKIEIIEGICSLSFICSNEKIQLQLNYLETNCLSLLRKELLLEDAYMFYFSDWKVIS